MDPKNPREQNSEKIGSQITLEDIALFIRDVGKLVNWEDPEEPGVMSAFLVEKVQSWLFLWCGQCADLNITFPIVGPGPNYSIDVHWPQRKGEMDGLVNLSIGLTAFYLRKEDTTIEGKILGPDLRMIGHILEMMGDENGR